MALQFQVKKMLLFKVEIELHYFWMTIMKQVQQWKSANAMTSIVYMISSHMKIVKTMITLSFIFGELGECHVSPIKVWQWIKQESINIPISFRCWNSFTVFSKELRKPDIDNFQVIQASVWILNSGIRSIIALSGNKNYFFIFLTRYFLLKNDVKMIK